MAHIQYLEELIKEYLVFRGYSSTLKSLDQDLKSNNKEKSFRVDKIIEQLMQFITNYDLNGIRELWTHFDNHLFNKLESTFMPSVKKLENAILKLYVINAAINNKPDKVIDFFFKMTPELQNQIEWREWFVLPYIKNPEENSTFALQCTKQWQDSLLVSIHNFLATIFQYMPVPALAYFEEDANKILKLEQRNESLKNRLALLIDNKISASDSSNNVVPCQVEPPHHLLDDFYIIAQENNIINNDQAKSLKSIIRNMGATTTTATTTTTTGFSPIMGRKETGAKKRTSSVTRNN